MIAVFGAYTLGSMSQVMQADAASGSLQAQGDTWTTSQSETVIVGKTGTYKIDVAGGGFPKGLTTTNMRILQSGNIHTGCTVQNTKHILGASVPGGHIVGELQLKKGDVIRVERKFADVPLINGTSAVWDVSTCGKDALLVYVNNKPVIGGAGASILARVNTGSWGWGYGTQANADSTGVITYQNQSGSVNNVNNSNFGAGDTNVSIDLTHMATDKWGYEVWHNIVNRDKNGYMFWSRDKNTAIDRGGDYWALNRKSNYLDPSMITLKSQPNDSVSTEPLCKITCTKADVTAEDMYTASVRTASALEQLVGKFIDGLKVNVTVNNDGVVSAINNLGNKMADSNRGVIPDTITVVRGKEFDEYIRGEDSTQGGTVDGITVINNDNKDGYVRIMGKINTRGTKEVVIDGIKYVLKVVEEPDSTNIKAVLN